MPQAFCFRKKIETLTSLSFKSKIACCLRDAKNLSDWDWKEGSGLVLETVVSNKVRELVEW